jgi:hypothetical protein
VAPSARNEFRVWAENLEEVKNHLQQSGTTIRAGRSQETYLLSAATDECNAKIRHGSLDIKNLIGAKDNLQHWQPVLKARFSVESMILTAQVFPFLKLKPPPFSRWQYQEDEFLNEVVSTGCTDHSWIAKTSN